jgi:hypothetical protein
MKTIITSRRETRRRSKPIQLIRSIYNICPWKAKSTAARSLDAVLVCIGTDQIRMAAVACHASCLPQTSKGIFRRCRCSHPQKALTMNAVTRGYKLFLSCLLPYLRLSLTRQIRVAYIVYQWRLAFRSHPFRPRRAYPNLTCK